MKKHSFLSLWGLLILTLLTQAAMGADRPGATISIDQDIWINPDLPIGTITPAITSEIVLYADNDYAKYNLYGVDFFSYGLTSEELSSRSKLSDFLPATPRFFYLKTGEESGHINSVDRDEINLFSEKYVSKYQKEGGYYVAHIPIVFQLFNADYHGSHYLLDYMKQNGIYDLPTGKQFFAGFFNYKAEFRASNAPGTGYLYTERPVFQGGTVHYVPTLKSATASGGNITGDIYLLADNNIPKGGYDLVKTPASTSITLTYTGNDAPSGLQLSVADKTMSRSFSITTTKSLILPQPSTNTYREVYETGAPGIGYRLTGKGGKTLSLKGEGVTIDTVNKTVKVPVELWFVATGDINSGTKAQWNNLELGRLVLITGSGKDAVMHLASEGSLTYSGKVSASAPPLGCDPE
ncbi:hypothetical protein [Pantoea sp. App145]|uniref:hypothetical protein n=1 Tax=Pantoea sp. App145 TaxID=3071567 RepID=UPI003A7F7E08